MHNLVNEQSIFIISDFLVTFYHFHPFILGLSLGVQCPWNYQTTKKTDMLICNDGFSCNGELDGFTCCNDHLGRALCPKNQPVMCNARECATSENNNMKDYCCEKSENICEEFYGVGKRICNLNDSLLYHKLYSCPWKHDAAPRHNLMKCVDGHLCKGDSDLLGRGCCWNHGGISVCPSNYPVMCDQPICGNGTDYCCEGSSEECLKKYKTKARPCEKIEADTGNIEMDEIAYKLNDIHKSYDAIEGNSMKFFMNILSRILIIEEIIDENF